MAGLLKAMVSLGLERPGIARPGSALNGGAW